MKCQRCPKQATLHITEVLPLDKFEEYHLCEECAKKYLYPMTAAKKSSGVHADDPGGKVCEVCGLKFVEFRNTGRLGCPHDYDSFRAELVPLLESIHGEPKHQGKTPRRLPRAKAGQRELAQLRRSLQEAISDEKYEEAARLRDRIRQLEEG
ncbi:MAG: UvrB/UvrC motif-containing protein [Fimbriiglobus sp.]|jgi:protein arginine kinase activator|nr:UvrB/UvrC motif-containing protein [Fimbriiglobus sp.]